MADEITSIRASDAELQWLYEQVSGWIRHAEAKHSVLIALAGSWSAAASAAYIQSSSAAFHSWLMLLAATFALAAAFASASSFVPKLSYSGNRIEQVKSTQELNIIYFEDLKHFEFDQLKQALGIQYESKFTDDLISQIISNSEIASSKFGRFKLAAWLASASALFSVLTLIVELVL